MAVNRSGYYKWRKRKGKPNRYEQDRMLLTHLLATEHKKYPSHEYHRLADNVFAETGWIFSHKLAHKRCKAAGIHYATPISSSNKPYYHYFNNRRPAAALGYKSPVQYKTELGL